LWLGTTPAIAQSAIKQQADKVPLNEIKWGPDKLEMFNGQLLDYQVRLMMEPNCQHGIVTPYDAEWVRERYETTERLDVTVPSFSLALAAANGWRQASSDREAITKLWTGIEALFDFGAELRFRFALTIASLLEARGDSRKERFRAVRRLYDQRSASVHGGSINRADLRQSVQDSFTLLRELLLLVIERGRMFTDDDIDSAIFS
jgi:hypothetical protein